MPNFCILNDKLITPEDIYKFNIDKNSVSYNDAICKLYTIHSYKGMEDDNIRMANDIYINNDDDSDSEEENLYYVAITRGMKKIIIDKV